MLLAGSGAVDFEYAPEREYDCAVRSTELAGRFAPRYAAAGFRFSFGFVETSVITAVSARPHGLCAVGRKAADAHVVELSAGLMAAVTASHSGQCADAAAQDLC